MSGLNLKQQPIINSGLLIRISILILAFFYDSTYNLFFPSNSFFLIFFIICFFIIFLYKKKTLIKLKINMFTLVKLFYLILLIILIFSSLKNGYVKNSIIAFGILLFSFVFFNISKYKDLYLWFSYGLISKSIIISSIMIFNYITTRNLTRSFSTSSFFSKMYGVAYHYAILYIGFLALILVKEDKNNNSIFSRNFYFFLFVLLIAFSLTAARNVAVILLVFLLIALLEKLKLNFVIFMKYSIIMFLTLLILIILSNFTELNIFNEIILRFKQNLNADNYLVMFFGNHRAKMIRIFLNTQYLSLIGQGKGYWTNYLKEVYITGSHNFYLSILVDGGIISFILYILILIFLSIKSFFNDNNLTYLKFVSMYLILTSLISDIKFVNLTILIGLSSSFYLNNFLCKKRRFIKWKNH